MVVEYIARFESPVSADLFCDGGRILAQCSGDVNLVCPVLDTCLNDSALIERQMLSVVLKFPFHVHVHPICMLITSA